MSICRNTGNSNSVHEMTYHRVSLTSRQQDARASSPQSSFSFCSTSPNGDRLCGCEPEGLGFLLFAAGLEVRSSLIILCRSTQREPYFPRKSHTFCSRQWKILHKKRRRWVDVRGEERSASVGRLREPGHWFLVFSLLPSLFRPGWPQSSSPTDLLTSWSCSTSMAPSCLPGRDMFYLVIDFSSVMRLSPAVA